MVALRTINVLLTVILVLLLALLVRSIPQSEYSQAPVAYEGLGFAFTNNILATGHIGPLTRAESLRVDLTGIHSSIIINDVNSVQVRCFVEARCVWDAWINNDVFCTDLFNVVG